MPHKRPRIYSLTTQRLREIERIVRSRHVVVPDTDDADRYLYQVACCMVCHFVKRIGRRPGRDEVLDRLNVWCDAWAPEVSAKLRRDAVEEARRTGRVDDADECARRLRVSFDERRRLCLTTIGSYDVNKRERARRNKARKRKRDRERARRKRAARGARSREEYLSGSLSATQPWKAEGVSRRTWERRRARQSKDRDAGPSPTITTSMLGDAPAAPDPPSSSRLLSSSPTHFPSGAAGINDSLSSAARPARGHRMSAQSC